MKLRNTAATVITLAAFAGTTGTAHALSGIPDAQVWEPACKLRHSYAQVWGPKMPTPGVVQVTVLDCAVDGNWYSSDPFDSNYSALIFADGLRARWHASR